MISLVCILAIAVWGQPVHCSPTLCAHSISKRSQQEQRPVARPAGAGWSIEVWGSGYCWMARWRYSSLSLFCSLLTD